MQAALAESFLELSISYRTSDWHQNPGQQPQHQHQHQHQHQQQQQPSSSRQEATNFIEDENVSNESITLTTTPSASEAASSEEAARVVVGDGQETEASSAKFNENFSNYSPVAAEPPTPPSSSKALTKNSSIESKVVSVSFFLKFLFIGSFFKEKNEKSMNI